MKLTVLEEELRRSRIVVRSPDALRRIATAPASSASPVPPRPAPLEGARRGRDRPPAMATSSGDDLVRSIGFLFSRNRLNVAIPQAQALAVLVASPKLLEIRCRSIEDMRPVSALCRFVELASPMNLRQPAQCEASLMDSGGAAPTRTASAEHAPE